MIHPTDTARGTGRPQTRMVDEWYIDAGGRTEGPLSDDELRSRAAGGLLQPTDRVSTDRAQWVAANSVPGLAFPSSPARVPGSTVAPAPRPLVETVIAGATVVPQTGSAPEFSPLESVPGYDLQGLLGTGACGVVFRAVQKKLNRVVALKTVRLAQNMNPELIVRFEQEAVSLARLQHPNIVAVYDCGHSGGRAFFAMELLEGEDLGQRLDRDGPLDERTAWLVARQTAAALDHAAQHGVIHRDVKPANLFLVPPPTGFPLPFGVPMVKVTDFGLALTLRGPEESDLTQTATGVIIGTPVYMAPEQFRGGPVDPRADIYSLGVTISHVLTGQIPFDGRTLLDVMAQKSAPCPRLEAPISEATADLVAAMMATDAGDRPSNYSELIARIDALPCLDGAFTTAGLPIVTPVARSTPDLALPPAPSKRRRWVYAATAVALLGVVVGIATLAGAFDWPRENVDAPLNAANYVPTGSPQGLFDGKHVSPWVAPFWSTEQDGEDKPVLTGTGFATRRLPEFSDFRVAIGLDPHEATTIDVVLATGGGPPATAVQWLIRIDRANGAAFGKRVGPSGAFEPVGGAVPVPTAEQRAKDEQPPYLGVNYARAGGTLTASFNDRPLGGTPAAGLHTTELRLEVKGGRIRIESAVIEELAEEK